MDERVSELPDPTDEFLARARAEISRAQRDRLEARRDFLEFAAAQHAAKICPACGEHAAGIKGLPESQEPGAPGKDDHWIYCRDCDVYWESTGPRTISWRVFAPHPWQSSPGNTYCDPP